MGAIPTQRENLPLASDASGAFDACAPERAQVRAILAGNPLAPGSARALVRAALVDWAEQGPPALRTGHLADDVLLVVSELVTNAVVHAGTDVELVCRLEEEAAAGAVVVEVSDQHPSRAPRDGGPEPAYETPEYGRGLRLVATLAEAWGVTYRRGAKAVWARLPFEPPDGVEAHDDACAPAYALGVAEILAPEQQRAERDGDWLGRGALTFLAEASDLLAGQLDEDLVAALTGQLLVPRLADWCAVWLEDEATGRGGWSGDLASGAGPRLARVWHGSENVIEELRRALEKDPPRPSEGIVAGPVPFPWPAVAWTGDDSHGPGDPCGTGDAYGIGGSYKAGGPYGAGGSYGTALAYRLVAGGRPLGTLVIGRAGLARFPDEVTGLVEDLSRRVALAIGAARQYARQATISAVLQRGLLPGAVAEIPGVRSALVYEPRDKGGPSGDFYDLFPAGDGRWCFAVGDVQGKGPEAAVVIGLARPWLRLLAREGYRVADVLDRLNQLLLDDATEAADASARALVGPAAHGDGPQTRFLSLLYGELAPFDGGLSCTLASAGHPLPLLLGPDGDVRTVARPQTLLGVVEDETYTSETFELRPGDSLLCVTDGVTERRSGSRQFDDGDGLAVALAGCAGLDAELIAERIIGLVHEFGGHPPEDDLALLVLQAE
ncbi:SpoIIE family protein phosphatase [Streptomyces adustus]|uniref:SpoIIE family protein phosphatase n=1 Tax=Streptomyces adustus TaxID=1609272 RepID=A0A5N8VQ25_9ACTN|nr:ATP-binding SpoIIE family protein phosphatase [Streptomyces adustus]MPY36852.1 SpoIIE family protein phosphatase [Streptomyces adustus]